MDNTLVAPLAAELPKLNAADQETLTKEYLTKKLPQWGGLKPDEQSQLVQDVIGKYGKPIKGSAPAALPPASIAPSAAPATLPPTSVVPARSRSLGKPATPTPQPAQPSIMSQVGQATISAGKPLTDPLVTEGMKIAGTEILGPLGAGVGEAAADAYGLGRWGTALLKGLGNAALTAPLTKNPVSTAGWTTALSTLMEGSLYNAGKLSAEAGQAEDLATTTGASATPSKIKALDQQRKLLQAGGATPEQINGVLKGADVASADATKTAYNGVIRATTKTMKEGYDAVLGPVKSAPADIGPVLQKVDELRNTIAQRGAEDQESAALKKFLINLKGKYTPSVNPADKDAPVLALLNNSNVKTDVEKLTPRQMDNYRQMFIKNGELNPDGTLPSNSPVAQSAATPTIERLRGLSGEIRGLRTPGASNTTKMVSNELEGANNQAIKDSMLKAGSSPEDIAKVDRLDKQWGTLQSMKDDFHNLNGVQFGAKAAKTLWDVGESGNYESLNHFITLAQQANKVDPETMPALRQSFLLKLVGDAQSKAPVGDIKAQNEILGEITDTFRSKTPMVMKGLFGEGSLFADARQFSRVMARSVDPNTDSKVAGVIKKAAKVGGILGSGTIMFRILYGLENGGSPWQDLAHDPGKFAIGTAKVVTTGAVAALVLSRGSAVQQRLWANMLLNPNAANVNRFSEATLPLISEQLAKRPLISREPTNNSQPGRSPQP